MDAIGAGGPYRGAWAHNQRRNVIDTPRLPAIRVAVRGVGGEVNGIACRQRQFALTNRQREGAGLHGDELMRSRCVRGKGAGVATGRQGGAYPFEVHSGDDRAQDSALPATRFIDPVLVGGAAHDDPLDVSLGDQTCQRDIQSTRDAVQHRDSRRLLAALHR